MLSLPVPAVVLPLREQGVLGSSCCGEARGGWLETPAWLLWEWVTQREEGMWFWVWCSAYPCYLPTTLSHCHSKCV